MESDEEDTFELVKRIPKIMKVSKTPHSNYIHPKETLPRGRLSTTGESPRTLLKKTRKEKARRRSSFVPADDDTHQEKVIKYRKSRIFQANRTDTEVPQAEFMSESPHRVEQIHSDSDDLFSPQNHSQHSRKDELPGSKSQSSVMSHPQEHSNVQTSSNSSDDGSHSPLMTRISTGHKTIMTPQQRLLSESRETSVETHFPEARANLHENSARDKNKKTRNKKRKSISTALNKFQESLFLSSDSDIVNSRNTSLHSARNRSSTMANRSSHVDPETVAPDLPEDYVHDEEVHDRSHSSRTPLKNPIQRSEKGSKRTVDKVLSQKTLRTEHALSNTSESELDHFPTLLAHAGYDPKNRPRMSSGSPIARSVKRKSTASQRNQLNSSLPVGGLREFRTRNVDAHEVEEHDTPKHSHTPRQPTSRNFSPREGRGFNTPSTSARSPHKNLTPRDRRTSRALEDMTSRNGSQISFHESGSITRNDKLSHSRIVRENLSPREGRGFNTPSTSTRSPRKNLTPTDQRNSGALEDMTPRKGSQISLQESGSITQNDKLSHSRIMQENVSPREERGFNTPSTSARSPRKSLTRVLEDLELSPRRSPRVRRDESAANILLSRNKSLYVEKNTSGTFHSLNSSEDSAEDSPQPLGSRIMLKSPHQRRLEKSSDKVSPMKQTSHSRSRKLSSSESDNDQPMLERSAGSARKTKSMTGQHTERETSAGRPSSKRQTSRTEFHPEEDDGNVAGPSRSHVTDVGHRDDNFISPSKTHSRQQVNKNDSIRHRKTTPNPSIEKIAKQLSQQSGSDESANEHEVEAEESEGEPRQQVKRKRTTSDHAMPDGLTQSIMEFYSQTVVRRSVIPAVNQGLDNFWIQTLETLDVYAKHAGRQKIEISDVELLLCRIGYCHDRNSMNALIEKYLPADMRRSLIPMAQAGNVTIPKVRK